MAIVYMMAKKYIFQYDIHNYFSWKQRETIDSSIQKECYLVAMISVLLVLV